MKTVSKHVLSAATMLLCVVTTAAQCQNQTCVRNPTCYQCGLGPREACSVDLDDCTRCAMKMCKSDDVLVPAGGRIGETASPDPREFADLGSTRCLSSLAMVSTRTQEKELPSEGTVFRLMRTQLSRSAALISATFGWDELFLEGRLVNLSDKPIVGYRIGWIYGYRNRRLKTGIGQWMNVPSAIPPGTAHPVPAQGLSSKEIGDKQLAVVQFFVAEVKFKDGTRWKQDLSEVRKEIENLLFPKPHSTNKAPKA